MIGTVTQLQCRSYASLEFDGCPTCTDAALEAVEQAALYILGRAALDQPGRGGESIEMAYTMSVRVLDEQGRTIAQDQIAADQSIGLVPADQDDGLADDETDESDERPGMRLEDFQTVVDRLELSLLGSGMCGQVAGHLYGFERSIGRFEVEVAPAH
jgi:hypothetical protein